MHSVMNFTCLLVLTVLLSAPSLHCLRINSLIELQKDSSSITIEWSVSPDQSNIQSNSTEAVTWVGFKIKYFTDTLQYTPILLKNILFRKFRLDNLKPHTEYKIQVSAYDDGGNEGPASRLLSVKTFETVPGAPQDFKLIKVTSDSIEIEWKPPRSDDSESSGNVKGYEIHYWRVFEASSKPLFNAPDAPLHKIKLSYRKLKHRIGKLEPNALYKITIFAYNMKGDGLRSNQLLVQTMEEGPNKPENIRSEIYNNLLHIKWSPPSIGRGDKLDASGSIPVAARQRVAGYRLYFNNEKYEVDEQTTQITFQRPKWEYDRQYEFRIAAKSVQSDNSVYGQEAVFRISTSTNQSQIKINLERLTSTSVHITWNNISFTSHTDSSSAELDIGPSVSHIASKSTHYKLSYWLKTDPINPTTLDELTTNQLQLNNLTPNSDYIVQIVAFGTTPNGPMTSEIALKHFKTLIDDIKQPGNLQVTRVTYDKLNIKWDPVVLYDRSQNKQNFNLIKGYKVYYKEIVPEGLTEETDYDSYGETSDWTVIETINGDFNTELNLEDLNVERDYAIKVAAVDHSDNEGPQTEVKIAYSLLDSSNTQNEHTSKPLFEPTVSLKPYTVNEKVGTPIDFKISESTTSVKLSWRPPIHYATQELEFQVKSFLITYIDQIKRFKASNGSLVDTKTGVAMSIKVPARDDPTMEIYWLVSSLQPDTVYDFNVSAVVSGNMQGPAVSRTIKTRRDRPIKVDPPQIEDTYLDNTVLIRTGNASEQYGPIKKYWLVVTPISPDSSNKQLKNNYETREKDIRDLLKHSVYKSGDQVYANGSSYIVAEFQAQHWPPRFILGDGRLYGRFFNRRLIKNFEYRAYTVAFTDVTGQQTSQQSQLNSVNLGDLIQSVGPESDELYKASDYSEVFGIDIHMNRVNTNSMVVNGIRIQDPQALLWAFGLIVCAALILVVLCCIHVRQRKKKLDNGQGANTILLNGRGTSSTMSSNLNHRQMEASLKNGGVITNTLKAGGITKHSITLNNGMNNKHSDSSDQNLNVPATSSSSNSSSTTASPTTALLSLSVNNHSNNNVCDSQSSNNTNSNQLIPLNGLLTTASPLRSNHHNPSESLYTSIEVTQKLLQQQQQLTSNTYDNNSHNQQLMMLMQHNNMQSTFTGTLTRSHQQNNANTLTIGSFDPVELRRIQYQTLAMQQHPPIHIEDLFQHMEQLKAHNNAQFSAEYESIEPGQQFQWDNSVIDYNRQKNRYANVIAYDHSRVILVKLPEHLFTQSNNFSCGTLTRNNPGITDNNYYGTLRGGMGCIGDIPPPPPPPPGTQAPVSASIQAATSDYINANFIDGYRKRNAYIATQGPLPGTTGDFWRMIWEQQTCSVVMLTKLEERSRLKCDQYWPTKGTEIYGNCVQVTLVESAELATYTVRTFVIAPVNTYAQIQIANNSSNMNYELRREIKHFQYTSWPDHGVPEHATSFLMFVRRVKNTNPLDAGPIVVHCSAGVGRTGCYINVDTMLEKMRSEKVIDVYGHVTCMRSQRNYMVQTEEQYVFCYDAVLEALQSGLTEVPARNLYQHLQRLLQISPDDPTAMLTEMELEYKRLSNIKAPQSKFQSANLASNKFKNRLVNILPYELTRVTLQPLSNALPDTGTDYINANFIDGYKYKRAYIATQAPLSETVDDFWRMLWEHNSTIIVMLTKLREMGREKCAQYWPTERSIRYQYFVVDPIAEYNMSQYILREFKVTDARDGQSRTIRQFQFVDWPEQGVPKSGESIIELIGQVHKTKEQFGQTGPITVHCSAGVGRTGVFITLGIVLERTRFEGMIDVFNTVKVLRTQRPAMVQTEDQYQFCYRAALEYLGSYDSYE